MRKLATAMLGALALSGLALGSAVAADKKVEKATKEVAIKVLSDDAKVRVFEATYVPGSGNSSPPASSTRVVRAIKPGQLTRIYPDGKTEVVNWKAGMVQVLGPGPAYTTKNTGKSVLQLYVVVVK